MRRGCCASLWPDYSEFFFAAGSDEVGDVGINCERLGDVDDRVGFESFGLIPNSPADRTAGLP
jgi:hypothetical protein